MRHPVHNPAPACLSQLARAHGFDSFWQGQRTYGGHAALARGTQLVLEAPAGMLAVERVHGGERLVIVANLTGLPAEVPALAGDGPDLLSGERKPLRAWQTALYRPAR